MLNQNTITPKPEIIRIFDNHVLKSDNNKRNTQRSYKKCY